MQLLKRYTTWAVKTVHLKHTKMLKVPLLWESKGSYFGFGCPQKHACNVIKYVHCLIICIYFFHTCSTSQTIRSTIHFSKPLLCVMLICGDWSDWSHFHCIMPVMSDKPAFVSTVLIYVLRYQGNGYFTAPKAASSGKDWICIFIQTNTKRTTSSLAIC